ncbi:MAG: cell division ATP-binding protein FtsE [Deltaproteobacteria bacterium GWC2_42_11]|nr:MAG: cell division ATP-binding protein FtsE [Deltaproteobacteria bacterium GWC2_42_11]HBO84596.1 cell division ATP-binding protein FtsE [Deltaproteobacteria bacterium]
MIQLYHVYKNYNGSSPALTDISFVVEKGEFVFLTGPSGAGKTTLLKLIFCSEKPTGGQIIIDGKNTSRFGTREIAELRRKIGFIFQDFKLLSNKTVYKNVALPLDIIGHRPREIKKKVSYVLSYLGLQHRANYKPLSISGGEQQRASIARALVKEPTILLADEPTGNLDPALTNSIMELFLDINAKGTTVVIATHDSSLIKKLNKRTITLEGGKVIQEKE